MCRTTTLCFFQFFSLKIQNEIESFALELLSIEFTFIFTENGLQLIKLMYIQKMSTNCFLARYPKTIAINMEILEPVRDLSLKFNLYPGFEP